MPQDRDAIGVPVDDTVLASVVSAADVARRLGALHDRFGAFPVVDATRENADGRFADGVEQSLAGWRGDAGAFVTDADGRVLLVRHADAPETWGTPGGGHESGEAFATTARRETREETGVDHALTGVHDATRTTIAHEDDSWRSITMLTVHFEGVVGTAAPDLDVGDDEILEARWFETPPDALHEHCREWVRDELASTRSVDEPVLDQATPRHGVDRAHGKRFVDAQLDALTEEFGEFPVRTETHHGDDEQFGAWMDAARDDARTGGGYCFITRTLADAPAVSDSMPDELDYSGERALLIMSRGEDEWSVPGGGVESAETFEAGAKREVREEVGLDVTVTDVRAADRGIGTHEDTGAEVHFLYVIFDASVDDGTVSIQASELNGACWFRDPPATVNWMLEDRLYGWFDE